MNKIITVYDLLGLIKDGKAPKKIKYKDNNYEFTYYDYRCIVNDLEKGLVVYWLIGSYNLDLNSLLNDKVEIIEEDKPIIEKLDVALLSQSDNWLWCPSKDEFSKDIELNSYIIQNIRENTLYFQRKINEIIDYINRKEDK